MRIIKVIILFQIKYSDPYVPHEIIFYLFVLFLCVIRIESDISSPDDLWNTLKLQTLCFSIISNNLKPSENSIAVHIVIIYKLNNTADCNEII